MDEIPANFNRYPFSDDVVCWVTPQTGYSYNTFPSVGIIFPSMSRTNPMNTHNPFSLLFMNNALSVSLSNADDRNSSRANSATASSASSPARYS